MRSRAGRGAFRSLLVVLSLVAVALAAAPGTAAEVPQCRVLDLSPDFQRDGTAFCADAGSTAMVVYRTTDRGRSWTRVGADSLWLLPNTDRITQIVVSAAYATDRTVYLATRSRIYLSQDAGDSWFVADLLSSDGSGRRVLSRFVDGASGISYLAFSRYDAPARLRPPFREPVAGALPANTDRFLLPERVTAAADPVLLAFDGRAETLRSTVYGCSEQLACTQARGSFPGVSKGAWRSPTYAADRTLYFATLTSGFTFLRSTDGGRTIKPFTSLNAALAPVRAAMSKRGHLPMTAAAMTFGPKGRIYLRLATGLLDDGKSPPDQLILRSDDGGGRWRQVAARYDGGRGNLPFTLVPNTTSENGAQIHAAPDGRVFAMGAAPGELEAGPWCSIDGGVRWHRFCPG